MTSVFRLRLTRTYKGSSTLEVGVTGLFDDFKAAVGYVYLYMRRGWLYLYLPLLRKKEKDVESVGSVAQLEKSAEKSQQKVFRNDYTAYTDYISRWGNFATPTGFEKEFAFYLDNLTLLSELLATHETEELIAD